MASGLQRAANAARASRGLRPRPVHLRSNRGNFAMCGVGSASATITLADDPDAATCGNCLRINRSLEHDREARELATRSLHRAD